MCGPFRRRHLARLIHEGDSAIDQRLPGGTHIVHAEDNLGCAIHLRREADVPRTQPERHRAGIEQRQLRLLQFHRESKLVTVELQ